MGVHTYSQEINLAVAPSRLFKALHVEASNLAPKISPNEIKSIEIVEGDGGVGTVRKTNFVEGLPVKFLVHKLDEIDTANHTCKFTLIDAEPRLENIETIVYEVKIEAGGEGSIVKLKTHLHTKGDYVPDEDKVKERDAGSVKMHKEVADYLIANPDVCA
ncbi:pathogenesis-related BetVI family protein [Proteus mirabilis]|nr:pathogenesis-related BetVI family protein [Proteus mirabilis]